MYFIDFTFNCEKHLLTNTSMSSKSKCLSSLTNKSRLSCKESFNNAFVRFSCSFNWSCSKISSNALSTNGEAVRGDDKKCSIGRVAMSEVIVCLIVLCVD